MDTKINDKFGSPINIDGILSDPIIIHNLIKNNNKFTKNYIACIKKQMILIYLIMLLASLTMFFLLIKYNNSNILISIGSSLLVSLLTAVSFEIVNNRISIRKSIDNFNFLLKRLASSINKLLGHSLYVKDEQYEIHIFNYYCTHNKISITDLLNDKIRYEKILEDVKKTYPNFNDLPITKIQVKITLQTYKNIMEEIRVSALDILFSFYSTLDKDGINFLRQIENDTSRHLTDINNYINGVFIPSATNINLMLLWARKIDIKSFAVNHCGISEKY